MDDASPLPSTNVTEKWSECISVGPLPSWVNNIIWSLSLHSSVVRWSCGIKLPPKLPQTQISHNDTPRFYSIKLLAKIKLITKNNNWTYISMRTTTLNDQNHILENCIGSVINFFILTEVPFIYMERAGFMTWKHSTGAASHQFLPTKCHHSSTTL